MSNVSKNKEYFYLSNFELILGEEKNNGTFEVKF